MKPLKSIDKNIESHGKPVKKHWKGFPLTSIEKGFPLTSIETKEKQWKSIEKALETIEKQWKSIEKALQTNETIEIIENPENHWKSKETLWKNKV